MKFKTFSIGNQIVFHWKSNRFPLEIKSFSIGIQNVFHWNSKSNPLDFANDLSGSVPLLHPSVTTLQVEAFSQMANVGGDITFNTYAKQTGGVAFLNKSLAPVGGITIGETACTARARLAPQCFAAN